MIQPSLNKLNVPLSDKKRAGDSELCWPEFLKAVSYFTDICCYEISEEEIADITKSLFNWTHRKDSIKYWVKDNSVTPPRTIEGEIKVGDIFLVDLGIDYKPECSYAHPALILEEIDGMVAIVPSSSNADKITQAFHPVSNNTGKWYYRKVDNSNGFECECVLLLNNLKVVSKARLLSKKGHLNENISLPNSLFTEIKQRIHENYFPKQYINNLKLSQGYDKLLEENENLKKQIELLKEKSQNVL